MIRTGIFASCAAAPRADVIRLWAGLGYNRRAVNLHRAAEVLVERHDGELPDDLDALLALPGVGPYTARAVLAFAFERPASMQAASDASRLQRSLASASRSLPWIVRGLSTHTVIR